MFKAASGAVYRRVKASGGGPRSILSTLLRDGNTVANYQPGNYTGTLTATAWANSIGAAPSLNGTGHAPIIVSADSVKKIYLPGVAANTLTSPNKTVTGNQTITFSIALDDYTPAADVTLFDKSSGNNGFTVKWLTTDKVRLVVGDGASLTNVDVVAASSFTDGTKHTVTIDWADGVGATFSYDGVQSGSQVPAAKTLTNAAVALTIGSTTSKCRLYGLTVGTVYNPQATDWPETSTNGATATDSLGNVFTLNNTGATPAQIAASPSLLFDGVAMFMSMTTTLAQPTSVYLVGRQVTWTLFDNFFDGLTQNTGTVYQETATPNVRLYAGAGGVDNGNWPVGTYEVLQAVFNGASSSIKIGLNAAATGNAGTGNMGGMTLGAKGTGGSVFGNLQVKEIILRSAADSAATQAQIQRLLAQLHGTP